MTAAVQYRDEAANSERASDLESLERQAWVLHPPRPDERASLLRPEAARLVDRLLTRAVRGRGALDLALGEGLAAMSEGDRALRLGFSGLVDYARERLGLAGRTAQAMAHLSRELRARPLLREAVRKGEVSTRKAETVLRVARGEDEAAWVARARRETVRALEVAANAAAAQGYIGGSSDASTALLVSTGLPAPDERWEQVSIQLSTEERATVDEALELAKRIIGPNAPPWELLEALCSEYLGSHPVEPSDEEVGLVHGPWRRRAEALAELKEHLEKTCRGWPWLDAVDPVEARLGAADEAGSDPRRLDELLRALVAERHRWDEVFGHLSLLLCMCGLWRDMQFASLDHYCAERLGVGTRTVQQRAWLERRLYSLPALRTALRERRISYEKARLVAGRATDGTTESWVTKAQGMSCIALRRLIDADRDTQMRAQRELDERMPRRVLLLLSAAIRAVRAVHAEEGWLSPGACLVRVAHEFITTYGHEKTKRRTSSQRILERDGGHCQVPGCSRAALQAHHLVFRSQGGTDDPSNEVGLCPPHHLHGVHAGYLRVWGRAPDQLFWELGGRRVDASGADLWEPVAWDDIRRS